MGFWERLTRTAAVVASDYDFSDYVLPARIQWTRDMTVAELYASQPHLRTVVSFMAEQVSSVGLHLFRRGVDDARERVRAGDADVRAGELAGLARVASPGCLTQEFIYSTVVDFALYDEFFWLLGVDRDGAPSIRRIPPEWVQLKKWRDPWELDSIVVPDGRGGRVKISAEHVVHVHGYHPEDTRAGVSPVESLRRVLLEQLEAAKYRSALWQHGPRLSGVIERPAGVKWDDVARRRFKAAWRSQFAGDGSQAGGTALLEDGMSFKPFHLRAQDEQVVEMTKLSLATVAQVYHINPTMVGLLDNANYSNVREFRRALFGDSLGGIVKRIETALTEFVIPRLHPDGAGLYFEFNLDEKLRGSFEERAAVTSTSTGAPWLMVNEARKMNNLPPVEGGDVLVRPLNMAGVGEDDAPGDDSEVRS